MQLVALAPHRQLELYGSVAESVVVGVVLELETLAFWDELADQVDARARPGEKRVAGFEVRIFTEAVTDILYPLGACGCRRLWP